MRQLTRCGCLLVCRRKSRLDAVRASDCGSSVRLNFADHRKQGRSRNEVDRLALRETPRVGCELANADDRDGVSAVVGQESPHLPDRRNGHLSLPPALALDEDGASVLAKE